MARYAQYINNLRFQHEQLLLRADLIAFVPQQAWQQNLYAQMFTPPLPRRVHWYYSSQGGIGKTTFANNFRFLDGKQTLTLTSGKHDDLRYVLSQVPSITTLGAVFFDFTRSQQETIPYTVLEQIKNRRFISTKYQSVSVVLPELHLVCFSNDMPDISKMSQDRWDIREIRNHSFI